MSPYPQPAEYIYCRVTNVQVRPDRSQVILSLMSDSGEPLPDVPVSVADAGQKALEIQPGDRFTFDGDTLGNRMPITLAAQYQEMQADFAKVFRPHQGSLSWLRVDRLEVVLAPLAGWRGGSVPWCFGPTRGWLRGVVVRWPARSMSADRAGCLSPDRAGAGPVLRALAD